MKTISRAFLIALCLLPLFSCHKDDEVVEEYKLFNAEEGDHLSNIIGSPNDSVFVVLYDGPDRDLNTHRYQHIFESFNSCTSNPFSFYALQTSIIVNQMIWAQGRDFDYDEAKIENDKTIRILENTIRGLKMKNKKVFLLGKSFGGLLLKKFLSQGSSEALSSVEKIIFLSTRLDDDPAIVQGWKDGKRYGYIENKLVEEDNLQSNEDFVRQKLLVDVLSDSYSKGIQTEFLNKVIFVYGNADKQGRFSYKEEKFLIEHQASVLLWEYEDQSSYLGKRDLIETIVKEMKSKIKN